jgi:hypothetical protein
MQTDAQDHYFPEASPIGLVEEYLFQLDWDYERSSENEIMTDAEGRWCAYRLFAIWRQDMESMIISAMIDIKIPHDKRESVALLLSALNSKIWLGHFEIAPDDDVPTFRYNLTLRGNPTPTLDQIEEIIGAAVNDCDRLYPALQFVIWGGKNPEEALMAAMLDTYGEA